MNASNFIDFIERPNNLSRIPYEELKTLVVQYPYCQHLRFMLYLKSDAVDHKDKVRNFHLAATYAFNRKDLHRLISYHQTETETDELELVDLKKPEDVILDLKTVEKAEATKDEVSTPQAANVEAINELIADVEEEKMPVAQETEQLSLIKEALFEEELEEEEQEVAAVLVETPARPENVEIKEENPVETQLEEDQEEEEDESLPVMQLEEQETYDLDALFEGVVDKQPNSILASINEASEISTEAEVSEMIAASAMQVKEEEEEEEQELAVNEGSIEKDISEILNSNTENNDISDTIFAEVERMSNRNLNKLIEEEFSTILPQQIEMEEDERLKKLISAIELKKQAHIDSLSGEKEDKKEEKKKKQQMGKMLLLKQGLRRRGTTGNLPATTLANRDLVDNSDFFSETLARLLANQGKYKKAIKMYQKLIQSHPADKEMYESEIKLLEENL